MSLPLGLPLFSADTKTSISQNTFIFIAALNNIINFEKFNTVGADLWVNLFERWLDVEMKLIRRSAPTVLNSQTTESYT